MFYLIYVLEFDIYFVLFFDHTSRRDKYMLPRHSMSVVCGDESGRSNMYIYILTLKSLVWGQFLGLVRGGSRGGPGGAPGGPGRGPGGGPRGLLRNVFFGVILTTSENRVFWAFLGVFLPQTKFHSTCLLGGLFLV